MNDTFEKLYREDQSNVKKWEKSYTNEEFYKINKDVRRRLVKLMKNKKYLTPRENFIVAGIMCHGFNKNSLKISLKYIKKAQKEGYMRHQWTLGAIIDRHLQMQGKPQKYGTQMTELKNGKFKPYPVDGTITDKQRKAIGLPTLKKLNKR